MYALPNWSDKNFYKTNTKDTTTLGIEEAMDTIKRMIKIVANFPRKEANTELSLEGYRQKKGLWVLGWRDSPTQVQVAKFKQN